MKTGEAIRLPPFRFVIKHIMNFRRLTRYSRTMEGDAMDQVMAWPLTAILVALLMTLAPAAPPMTQESPIVAAAWSKASFTAAGKQVTVYLYAPDAEYDVQTDSYCGAMEGQTNASADQWAFYVSIDGAPPALATEIGSKEFPGGRGLKAHPLDDQTTILSLGDYLNCANPNRYDLWAYDHTTNQVHLPQMEREDGRVTQATAARFEVTPEGLLVSQSYNNAGDQIGWHTYTYKWDPTERMWLFEDHQYRR